MKILVVEDEFLSRQILSDILSERGKVDAAADGLEAIELFDSAVRSGIPYDLVCLDIMIPGVDGQNVLSHFREIEWDNNIRGLTGAKIVMTTALSDYRNISKAFNSQCDAYLTKPIDPDKLEQTLKDIELL